EDDQSERDGDEEVDHGRCPIYGLPRARQAAEGERIRLTNRPSAENSPPSDSGLLAELVDARASKSRRGDPTPVLLRGGPPDPCPGQSVEVRTALIFRALRSAPRPRPSAPVRGQPAHAGGTIGGTRETAARRCPHMTLTVREVEAARPGARVYRLYDSGGMYLEVRPSGARLWILRYRYHGREKRISLGPYPEVSLRAAREARDEARALLRQGIDPSAHRRAQRRTGAEQATVEALAWEWYETWRQGRAEKTIRTTDYYLRRIIIPALGATPIVELTPQAILDMVLPLVRREAIETAHRVVQRLSMICRYAIRTGRLQMDPAAHLSEALPVVRERHHPAIIDPAEWGALLRAIWSYEGHAVVRAALRMAPLVVVRPGELRGAEWSEIDFDTATWVIPASRMKMRQDH